LLQRNRLKDRLNFVEGRGISMVTWEMFAWSEITFFKPYEWEISKEEYSSKGYYLSLEDMKMRRLELKYEKVPFDKAPKPKKIIDDFISKVNEQISDIKVVSRRESSIYGHDAYKAVLRTGDFILDCYGWYCDYTERAFLLNFIYKFDESKEINSILNRILKSLKCHIKGNNIPWYFQGILISLPREFKPVEKKTTTGLSYLKFYHDENTALVAYNCMASLILEEESIDSWFKNKVFKESFKKYGKISNFSKEAVLKLNNHTVSVFSYDIRMTLSPRKRKCKVALWVCDETNRLICYTIVSKEMIRFKENYMHKLYSLFENTLKTIKCH